MTCAGISSQNTPVMRHTPWMAVALTVGHGSSNKSWGREKQINNGNRTEWRLIRSVIIRVWSPICLITSTITDWIGRHKVLSPSNHNDNKICDILDFFFKQNTRNFDSFFASIEKEKKGSVESCTVLLHCPVSAEIRAVHGQSDVRILL